MWFGLDFGPVRDIIGANDKWNEVCELDNDTRPMLTS